MEFGHYSIAMVNCFPSEEIEESNLGSQEYLCIRVSSEPLFHLSWRAPCQGKIFLPQGPSLIQFFC